MPDNNNFNHILKPFQLQVDFTDVFVITKKLKSQAWDPCKRCVVGGSSGNSEWRIL